MERNHDIKVWVSLKFTDDSGNDVNLHPNELAIREGSTLTVLVDDTRNQLKDIIPRACNRVVVSKYDARTLKKFVPVLAVRFSEVICEDAAQFEAQFLRPCDHLERPQEERYYAYALGAPGTSSTNARKRRLSEPLDAEHLAEAPKRSKRYVEQESRDVVGAFTDQAALSLLRTIDSDQDNRCDSNIDVSTRVDTAISTGMKGRTEPNREQQPEEHPGQVARSQAERIIECLQKRELDHVVHASSNSTNSEPAHPLLPKAEVDDDNRCDTPVDKGVERSDEGKQHSAGQSVVKRGGRRIRTRLNVSTGDKSGIVPSEVQPAAPPAEQEDPRLTNSEVNMDAYAPRIQSVQRTTPYEPASHTGIDVASAGLESFETAQEYSPRMDDAARRAWVDRKCAEYDALRESDSTKAARRVLFEEDLVRVECWLAEIHADTDADGTSSADCDFCEHFDGLPPNEGVKELVLRSDQTGLGEKYLRELRLLFPKMRALTVEIQHAWFSHRSDSKERWVWDINNFCVLLESFLRTYATMERVRFVVLDKPGIPMNRLKGFRRVADKFVKEVREGPKTFSASVRASSQNTFGRRLY